MHTTRVFSPPIMAFPFRAAILVLGLVVFPASLGQSGGTYLGNLSANPYAPNSTSNQFGAGSRFDPNSINNPYGQYGSKFSPRSARNPYATNVPRLYDSQGRYRGKLSANRFDPDSVSNPYGRYGSRFSPDSINNPYGAGNPFSLDSPSNKFGNGLIVIGE